MTGDQIPSLVTQIVVELRVRGILITKRELRDRLEQPAIVRIGNTLNAS